MKFREIESLVGDVPFITKKNGRYLYDLIVKERLTSILELGIAHGTATCYMAAALQELGEGHVTSVDLTAPQFPFEPSAEEQLRTTGLAPWVSIVRMQTGYTWFLHDAIRRNTDNDRCREVYDLCIIDGPKNWTIDGAAFFMVDKLLKPNGWIIFDDYNWTYAQADNGRAMTDGITHRSLSEDERRIPHIKEVFELLVTQHPNYTRFLLLDDGDWALAQKRETQAKEYTFVRRHEETYKDAIIGLFDKTARTGAAWFDYFKRSLCLHAPALYRLCRTLKQRVRNRGGS